MLNGIIRYLKSPYYVRKAIYFLSPVYIDFIKGSNYIKLYKVLYLY